MKTLTGLLFLLLLLPFTAGAQVFPDLAGRVVDQGAILSQHTEDRLTRLLKEHEETTDNQVVVVTVPSLQGYAIEEFAVDLARHWRIGQEGKNNGLLLLVAPSERKVRIEVGYGLEGDMPDATAHAIIQHVILPEFRNGNMGGGVESGVNAILKALLDGNWTPPEAPEDEFAWGAILAGLIFTVYAGLIVWPSAFYQGQGNWASDPSYLGRRHISYGLTGGGGSSGSGFFGGGFSGGGGSFGGGGASGGW